MSPEAVSEILVNLQLTAERLQLESDTAKEQRDIFDSRLAGIESKRFPLWEALSATSAILITVVMGAQSIISRIESNNTEIKAISVKISESQRFSDSQIADLKNQFARLESRFERNENFRK